MGAPKPLDKRINHYLGQLNNTSKKSCFNCLKAIAEKQQEETFGKTKAFIAELDEELLNMKAVKAKY